ncbi:MAG: SPOR domain-containing protein [Alphaproteobacteria bacterium]
MTTGTESSEDRQRLSSSSTTRPGKVIMRAWLFGGLIGLLTITGIAGITWYAVTGGGEKDAAGPAPLIKAETTPVKVRPEVPGGMEVPNRDKLVYSRISGTEAADKPVRLQPPPEIPVARPTPLAAAKTGKAESTATATPEPSPAKPEQLLPPLPQPKPIAKPSSLPAKPTPAPKIATAPAAKAEPPAPSPGSSPSSSPSEKSGDKSGEKLDIAAVAKRVAAVTPAAGGYRIQLLASKSEAKAKLARTRMLKSHGKLLTGLAFTVDRADLGKRGVFYRLRAGPLADRGAAEKLCARFKARKMECVIVNP